MKQPVDLEELLTAREVADMLKVSREWIYLQAKADLPSVKLGPGRGTLRFRRSDVHQFLKRCQRNLAAGKRLA